MNGIVRALLAIGSVLVGLSGAAGQEKDKVPVAQLLMINGDAVFMANGTGKTRDEAIEAATAAGLTALVTKFDEKSDPPPPLRKLLGLIQKDANAFTYPGADGKVQARIIARVPAAEIAAFIRKPAENNAKPPEGAAKIAAEIKAKTERAKVVEAWAEFAIRDYPYGCMTVEVAEWKELTNRRNERSATFEAKLRYAPDPKRYAEFSTWLVRTLEYVGAPAQPFTVTFDRRTGRESDNFALRVPPRNVPGYSEFLRPSKDDANSVSVVAVVETVKGDGPVSLSGRAVTLDKAVAGAFSASWSMRGSARTDVEFLDKDGAVVVTRGTGEERVGLAAQGSLPYRDDKGRMLDGPSHLFVMMPTARRQYYAPKCDQTIIITLTTQELEKVTLPPRAAVKSPDR